MDTRKALDESITGLKRAMELLAAGEPVPPAMAAAATATARAIQVQARAAEKIDKLAERLAARNRAAGITTGSPLQDFLNAREELRKAK